MKNTLSTFTFFIVFFFCSSILFAQTSNLSFGAHTIMGLSGDIRQAATTPTVDGRLTDFSGKEELQISYGVGLWLEHSVDAHWKIHATTSYQRVKVMANSMFVTDAPDLYYFSESQSSWSSHYLQLSLNGRYYFGEEEASQRWFVGAGVQGVYVYRHNYLRRSRFRYDPMLGPGFGFSGDWTVFTEKINPRSKSDMEKSPLGVAGRLELGLRINRWSLSLVNTAFFQKRREGAPAYERYLDFSEPDSSGAITVSGTPLRYVRSAALHFAYQIKK